MLNKKTILCPSARCENNAILLGIVKSDGRIHFVPQKINIDQDFVDVANDGRPPEKRFRFADKCLTEECKQWTGTRCGIIDELVEILGSKLKTDDLPKCQIRSECRWFEQHKTKACSICPNVITDLNSES